MTDDTIWIELPRDAVALCIQALETTAADYRALQDDDDGGDSAAADGATACGELAEQFRAALKGEVRP